MATTDLELFRTREIHPAAKTAWQRVRLALRVVQVRLRFIAVFVVAFVIVGNWHVLRNYWDRLTRIAPVPAANAAVSLDTEYFCPMDPGVVSDWSGKCGICNMALVRRKKGEMVQLPHGVVARMQLSPYRVQLAGIKTSAIGYEPLVREVTTVGHVAAEPIRYDATEQSPVTTGGENVRTTTASIDAAVFERDIAWLANGLTAQVTSEAFAGHAPFAGRLTSIADEVTPGERSFAVQLEVADPNRELRPGMFVAVRIEIPASQIEPFRSMPNSSPRALSEFREAFVCPEHPDILRAKPGQCPLGKNELERRALADNQRMQWWCPMHPKVVGETPGGSCKECEGMKLLPRVITFTPAGQVLAVPQSAVVDTGARRVVFVERGPGLFDGVEVVLGPRCAGDFFPVIKGIEAGQRVATAGAFLLDAESRLNPSVGVGYFGATEARK